MANVLLTTEQFDRLMRAAKFVESMQRGPIPGHEVQEQPAGVPTGEVWIKVTGPIDEDFRPEDTETDYYPCVLTEKFVLSTEDEAIYGPLGSYWHDYSGTDDEEFRCFTLNNSNLTVGNRYKGTPVDQQDGQYGVLGISDPGGGTDSLEIDLDGCNLIVKAGGEDVEGSPLNLSSLIDCFTCNTIEVVTGGTVSCEDDEVTFTPITTTISYVACTPP